MDSMLSAAKYMYDAYSELTGETIDEMKLHKLLYFTMREGFAITGEQILDGYFEGWVHGPVCREVRYAFTADGISVPTAPVSETTAYIIRNVILEYGKYDSWALREMSHKEISWQNAREGLRPRDAGSRVLEIADIREDAKRVRPYDHVWDMYYDEFEDLTEDELAATAEDEP